MIGLWCAVIHIDRTIGGAKIQPQQAAEVSGPTTGLK